MTIAGTKATASELEALAPAHQEALRARLQEATAGRPTAGLLALARAFGVASGTLTAAACGIELRPGTAALIRAKLVEKGEIS